MRDRTPEQNEAGLKSVVDAGRVPGMLAYVDEHPAGWCSIAPIEDYGRFADAKSGEATWVVACLALHEGRRGAGLTAELIAAAIEYASDGGATELKALPRDWRPDDPAGLPRLIETFRAAGFEEERGGLFTVHMVLGPP